MAQEFIGEIMIVPYNFAPLGWALCNGQLMPISQNTALFSLLGTTFGGDGKSNFALPNFQGSVPIQEGQGPGLSNYDLGESGGVESVALTANQIPAHTHSVNAVSSQANQQGPGGNTWAQESMGNDEFYSNAAPDTNMSPSALTNAGGGQPHSNMQPYLVMNFIIALQGIFPSRG